jgi:hypothetical protein
MKKNVRGFVIPFISIIYVLHVTTRQTPPLYGTMLPPLEMALNQDVIISLNIIIRYSSKRG